MQNLEHLTTCLRRRNCMLVASRYYNEALFMFDDHMSNTGQTRHVWMVILSLLVLLALGRVATARSIPIVLATKPCS